VIESGLVKPAFHHAPEFTETLGPEVADLAEVAGFKPYPEQRLALDALFALNGNKSAAFEVAVICCRQNLKTGLFKQAALGWLYITDQRLVVWSAHEFGTAQEAFRDMSELIGNNAYLSRRVKKIYSGNGDEAIEMMDGQRLIFKARTKGGGRGLSADKVVLDEAFALKPEHMGALLPALSARPDPQVVYGSSAGLASSDVLRSIRDRGRTGASPRLAYLEWCAERLDCANLACEHKPGTPGCQLDDVANWLPANPSIGRGPLSVDGIAAERQAMPPDEFARERMGWWDDPNGEAIISAAVWADCIADPPMLVERPRFALDVSPSRTWAAIAVAGKRPDDLTQVEITSNSGVVDHREGVDWVLPRLRQIHEKQLNMRLFIPSGSAAESLIPSIQSAGIPVEVIKASDVAASCGLFYDLSVSRAMKHLGQLELTVALMGASRLDVGDGSWKWTRRKSTTDITPLYAATTALWAAHQRKPAQNVW
jgi:hypothetical protein